MYRQPCDNFFYTSSHSTTGLPLPPFPPPALPPIPPPPFPAATPVVPVQPPTSISHPDGIAVSLPSENQWLWEQFYAADTEMIISKVGRRMFPEVMICVAGLEVDTKYKVQMEIRCVDGYRYKYVNSRWTKTAELNLGIPEVPNWVFHPHSPKTGSSWMKDPISFKKVKLTSDSDTQVSKGHIVLQSMHKYVPHIHILMETPTGSKTYKSVFTEALYLCQFVCVTAYKSKKITQMKIDFNPYAKAFREPDGESKGHGGAGPPLSSHSMTTPYPMATMASHPFNWSHFFPYGAGYYSPRPPYSGQVNYSHFPYDQSLIPAAPLASASVPSAGTQLLPFQYMQQWRPSRVGAAVAAVSNPGSSNSSRMSLGRPSSLPHATTTDVEDGSANGPTTRGFNRGHQQV